MKDKECKKYIHTYKCNATTCDGCKRRIPSMVPSIESFVDDLDYIFKGIEDGWLKPDKYDLDMYYAYSSWIKSRGKQ